MATAPVEVQQGYEQWKDIARISGPQGLKLIEGFNDEAWPRNWSGFRSSRLNIQYRVIDQVQKDQVLVEVERVTPHDYRRSKMSNDGKAIQRIDVSPGDSVRILRELQDMSQNDLAAATGIPQSTISAIENDRVRLGVERAKVLAKALRCHPAVLVFPGWDVEHESAA